MIVEYHLPLTIIQPKSVALTSVTTGNNISLKFQLQKLKGKLFPKETSENYEYTHFLQS